MKWKQLFIHQIQEVKIIGGKYETLFWKYGNYSNKHYGNCSSWIYWMLLIGMRIGKVGGLRWENIEMCHCHF